MNNSYQNNFSSAPLISGNRSRGEGIAILTSHELDVSAEKTRLFEFLLFFVNYAIIIPAFLLWWFAFIRWLRKIGVINHHIDERVLAPDHAALIRHAAGIATMTPTLTAIGQTRAANARINTTAATPY